MDITVTVIRDRTEMEIQFSEIKQGDKIPTRNSYNPIHVGVDSHKCGDASYDGFLFYDTNGNSYFPEDFINEPGLYGKVKQVAGL